MCSDIEQPVEPRAGQRQRAFNSYGRPPAEHQFKKGKSGNPADRPKKKKKGQSVDAAAILNEPLLVQTAGGPRTMPTYEIVVRRLVERAVKHKDLRAMMEFLKL